jgi:hypothetical protein
VWTVQSGDYHDDDDDDDDDEHDDVLLVSLSLCCFCSVAGVYGLIDKKARKA